MASTNVTTVYNMYTYDLCNGYFQQTMINKDLKSRILCSQEIFSNAKTINFDSFTPTIRSQFICYAY